MTKSFYRHTYIILYEEGDRLKVSSFKSNSVLGFDTEYCHSKVSLLIIFY